MPVFNQDIIAFLANAEQPISKAQTDCADVLMHSARYDQTEVDKVYAYVLGVLATVPGGPAMAKDWGGMNAPASTGAI